MGNTERLAQFLAGSEGVASVDEDTRRVLSDAVVDTVGVSLAAVESEAVERAAATIDPAENDRNASRVVGRGNRYAAPEAAWLTGIMAHALDFDDVHHGMRGHPTAPVLATILPLADGLDLDGESLLSALLLGTEAEIALAEALNPGHYESGWHPTAILGHVGATAAAGSLHDLDVAEFRHAIGIVASSAGGMKANFGSMTKPLHVGNAARNGIVATRLAREGFTANPNVLDEEFGGFADLFSAGDPSDLESAFDRLGTPWSITDPRIAVKPYPCCGSVHSAIDAARSIRDEQDVDPGSIDRIDVVEHPRRLPHTDRPDPETALEGKFSVQYCVAVALERGDVTLADFTREAIRDPDTRQIASTVHVHEDASMPAYGARLEIRTRERTLSHEIDAPRGSSENPMSRAEIDAKYERNAARALPEDRVTASLTRLRSPLDLDDGSTILDDLVPP
ncbi:MAG: MmgE/PrpD family protein [Halanaeroarchaeum sp.]